MIAVTVLTTVVVGFKPRWFCVPHCYIAFSPASRMSPADGGEQVAQIATLLFIPLCLGDARTWHWQEPSGPIAPSHRGSAYAALLVLRCQVAVVYLEAALSKLAYPSWRNGTAVPILLDDPEFGLPSALRPGVVRLLARGWPSTVVTWGTMVVELAICICVLPGPRARRCALMLTVLLHSAIAVAMGLMSFGLTMIATVLAATARPPRAEPTAPEPATIHGHRPEQERALHVS
ncbi:HTTM domain-containing protein [Streptomyces sp. NPDC001380]|uniref:HTTM domain-containing protein n=1 Tax=Streptomyces sp. NPDC001380 TaxID=3364566 RepID=UPI0036BB3AC7